MDYTSLQQNITSSRRLLVEIVIYILYSSNDTATQACSFFSKNIYMYTVLIHRNYKTQAKICPQLKSLIRCILSLSQAFFKQYRIKNIGLPPGIEPRTACTVHKHCATEL